MAKIDDIPEAVRKVSRSKSTTGRERQTSNWLGAGILTMGAMGLLSLVMFFRPVKPSSVPVISSPTPSPRSSVETSTKPVENILGHLPYQEASQSELKAITSDGGIRLRQAAADKFRQMQAAAKADGVILVPISGFRSVSAQQQLFFQVKAERNQETKKRAEVSAPPGYSEHHTGYAVDIGDGKVPTTNLSQIFENTAAFRWLEKNAARYSFELSFPPNNPQGISYEPWHWRYVGDSHSLETFYKAEQLKINKER
jgi:D-alanyl-D-alanine carboxypeptidase